MEYVLFVATRVGLSLSYMTLQAKLRNKLSAAVTQAQATAMAVTTANLWHADHTIPGIAITDIKAIAQ